MTRDIQIAITCDDNYAEPALLALYSALCHLEPIEQSTAKLHYFTLPSAKNNIITTVRNHFEAFSNEFGASSKIHIADPEVNWFENKSKPKSSAIFLRLFFSRFLTGDVVYLDPDVLVLNDLGRAKRLVDMDGHCFAGALDQGLVRRVHQAHSPLGKIRQACQVFGIKPSAGTTLLDTLGPKQAERYMNSGVMIFALDQWRARGCDHLIAEMGDIGRMRYRDQDALNSLSVKLGGYALLSPSWNRQSFKQEHLENTLVKHYVGPRKPWLAEAKTEKGGRLAWNQLYWRWQDKLDKFRERHNLEHARVE